MPHLHRLTAPARVALAAIALGSLPACWPLAPIGAAIAAAGGGGGSNNNAVGVSLSGMVITDVTVDDTRVDALDREPNDTVGSACPIREVAPAKPRRISGSTQVSAGLHALVADADGVDVLGIDLLASGAAEQRRFPASFPSAPTPSRIARRGHELFLIDHAAGRTTLRVTPLRTPFVKRRVELGLPVDPAGAVIALDALLLLESSAAGSRLCAFDADDGTPLVITDLRRDGLSQLAGGEEVESGRTRLFTCDPDSGELFEIVVAGGGGTGGDRRLDGLTALGAPGGLIGGIAALAYDGALLHAIDGAGTLHSLLPDSLREIASRPLASGAGEHAFSLVASLDLGQDCFHVEVPAGATLHVELTVTNDGPSDGRFFLAAIERAAVVSETLAEPAFFAAAAAGLGAAAHLETDLVAGSDAPKGFDVCVGTLAGSGSYVLALGGAAFAPAPAPARAPPDAAATALADYVELRLIASLPDDRLVELFRDPLLPEFVPGRVILGHRDGASSLAMPRDPKGFRLARVDRSPGFYDLLSVATTAEFAGPAVRTLHGATTRRSERREQARALLAVLDGLAGAEGVAYREPDYIARTCATPNDPGYAANQTIALDQLNLPAAWDITTGASTTILAIIDTGVRTDNLDLNANVGADGYDFIASAANGDGDGRDFDPFDPGSFASNGNHGSHCGGTAGARGDNALQGTGICWDAELMMLRALDNVGSGSTTDIAEAIKYAAGMTNATGLLPTQRAAAINLSLGLNVDIQSIHDAVTGAVGQGCVVLCAAGNDGNGTPVLYPAAYPESIAVAAADHAGGISFYSNSGPEIAIACSGGTLDGNPAHDIWSTVGVPAGTFRELAGTSMACAHATGVAGLMATMFPAITQSVARTALTTTAVDILTPGFDDLSGFGLVDAAAAVSAVSASLDLSAAAVDFGNTGTNLVVQARNSGGGNLVVNPSFSLTSMDTPVGVPPTTAWLAATLLGDGKTIHLDADRTVVPDGDYQVQVDVTSNGTSGGSGSFLVNLTVGLPGTDIGTVMIRVVADDGVTVVKQTSATAANGYAWSLSGLGMGQYFLQCGIDGNADGDLDDVGEVQGAYPSLGAPELLEVDMLNSLQIDLLLP